MNLKDKSIWSAQANCQRHPRQTLTLKTKRLNRGDYMTNVTLNENRYGEDVYHHNIGGMGIDKT